MMPKSTFSVAYEDTHLFTPLMMDYIHESPDLADLYSHYPRTENWAKIIEDKSHQNIDRNLLVKTLHLQYDKLADAEVTARIDSLLDPQTYTVCTAHQPLIFSGHAYFFHKIFHTICLSQKIQDIDPSKTIIPLFYMGTEDSDWDEIGTVWIKGTKYQWQPNEPLMSGRAVVDESFKSIQNEILHILGGEKHTAELKSILDDAYVLGDTLAQCTRRLIHSLVGKYGVLVLDADEVNLKKALIPAILNDIIEGSTTDDLVPSMEILQNGYLIQAPAQEYNFFWVENGQRLKIQKHGDDFKLSSGKVISRKEMIDTIHKSPEIFSANVIYRPLFQELILPNICFLGGGGECAYWLELKPLFDKLGVVFPPIKLRQTMGYLSSSDADEMRNSPYSFSEFFWHESALLKKHIYADLEDESYQKEKTNLVKALDSYLNELNRYPVSENQIRYAQRTLENLTQHLEKKIKKGLRLQKKSSIDQFQSLKAYVLPGGKPQERGDSFIQYLALYGKKIIDAQIMNIDDSNNIKYLVC